MTQARGVQGRLLRFEDPESAYGTDPSSAHSVSLPFNSFNVPITRNLIDPETITGRRDPVQAIQGRVDMSGTAVVPIDQYGIGYWLQGLLGTPVSTWTGSARQHTFTVNSNIGSFVYELGFTDVGAYNKYRGVKVGGASIRVGGDEELTMNFDLVGQVDVPGGSSMSSRITTISLSRFNQFHALLEEGGSALDGKVRDLELNIRNNLDTDVYTISSGGSATRGDLPEGICQVDGRMSMMFENWSYYARAVSGTERSLTLKFQSGSFYLAFQTEELLFERSSPPIETPQGVWQELPFKGHFRVGSNSSVIKATLVNTWQVYSGHL